MKGTIIGGMLWFVLAIALLVGEIKCVYKMVTCNWKPIGKAEIIYTVAVFTGLGSIIGYCDIEDK